MAGPDDVGGEGANSNPLSNVATAGGVVRPVGARKVVMKERKTKTKKKMGTPKCALDGRKWICEYFIDDRTGGPDTTITECSVKETVTIFRCVNAVVQIKGKINAILLDDCDKTSIVCSDVVSSIDIVNCNSVEVQTTGKVPTIAVDKTDGFQVYLSQECVDSECQLVTSKSSEMNVSFPDQTDKDGDWVERPIPEQFVHKVTKEHKEPKALLVL